MHVIHETPEEALQASRDLGAKTSIGMHFGTFPLGDDGETEPADRLRTALGTAPDRFLIPPFGEAIEVP